MPVGRLPVHRLPLVRRFGFLKVTPNLKNCGDNLPERCLMVNENQEAALTTICTPDPPDNLFSIQPRQAGYA